MADIKKIKIGSTIYDIRDATAVHIEGNETINGIKTFNAPTNASGTEQATIKLKTANGGAIIFGKEGPNSGSMIRLDQVDGTCRLKFRSSSTAGAMVWEQPESGSALYYDVANVFFRNVSSIQFSNFKSAGYLYTDSSGSLKKGTMPTSLKSPYSLKFGSKTYDGSVEQTITASDLGALTSHQDISGKVNKSGDTMTGDLTLDMSSGQSSYKIKLGSNGSEMYAASSNELYINTAKLVSQGNYDRGYYKFPCGDGSTESSRHTIATQEWVRDNGIDADVFATKTWTQNEIAAASMSADVVNTTLVIGGYSTYNLSENADNIY